jgi:integral membrane sensor domain MASE1
MAVAARGARWTPVRRDAALFAGIAACYAVGAELAWQSFGAEVGFAFFPPAGISLAALLLVDRTRWPAVLAAVAVTEVVVDLQHHLPLGIALGYAAANTAEPFVGALAVRRLQPGVLDLRRRPGALSFLLGACVAGPAVGALIGATTKTIHAAEGPWAMWAFQWCAGDGVAVLTIGLPILLLWRRPSSVTRPVELTLGAVVMFVASLVTFAADLPPSVIPLLLIVWAAFRLGVEGVAVIGAVHALVANYLTADGWGALADWGASTSTKLALTQLTIAAIMLAGWFLAIEIDALVEANTARTRAQDERDHAAVVASILQLAIQPEPPREVPAFSVGGLYEPSTDQARVGGDWYDVVVLPKDRILLVVGDVVGHGLDAVEDMTQLRFATRTLAIGQHPPSAILAELSELTASATRGQFATSVVAIYDPISQQLAYARAGHPPPALRRRATGDVAWLDGGGGVPLGCLAPTPYEDAVIELRDGDVVLLYSDGLVENRCEGIEHGLDRLADALATGGEDDDADRLCRRVIDRCRVGDSTADDVCILAAIRSP